MRIREPIQVYLSAEEREELDRQAKRLGVSRSELLRRGIVAVGRTQLGFTMADLADEGIVRPPAAGYGDPPPGSPVAPLAELLDELDRDRSDR